MGVSQVLLGFAGLTAGIAVIGNLPVTWFMSAEKATLKYLEKSRLQTIETNPRTVNAKELWKDNGAVIMAVRRPG